MTIHYIMMVSHYVMMALSLYGNISLYDAGAHPGIFQGGVRGAGGRTKVR